MGFSSFLVLLCLSWSFLILSTHQLQSSQTQILLQLRKQLEYPKQLEIWIDHTIDFCMISQTPQVNITCENNIVTELKIVGDKQVEPTRVSDFNGFPIPNLTLSNTFSMDSMVTTLARLNNLRSLALVSLGIWGNLPDKIHRLYSLEVLDLSSNFLFGSIPPQISRLAKLQNLEMGNNFFNDTFPDLFDPLANLSILSLRKNQLKGQVPDLSSLYSLNMLDLSENKFDSQIPNLPKGVIAVFLNKCSFSGEIPKQYSQLGQLQILDLSFNFLEGMIPSALFSLPNISFLNLASNSLSGPLSNDIKCGGKLDFLDVSNNKLTGDMPYCLSNLLEKDNVKYGGNCLSIDLDHQHPESYCLDAEKKGEKTRGKNVGVLIGVIGGVFVVAMILVFASLFVCRRYCCREVSEQHLLHKAGQENSATGFTSEILTNARFISESAKSGTQDVPMCRSFTLEELKEATLDFDNSFYLGEGSYGKLYKGRLSNGTQIAIRCLPLSKKYSIRNLKLRLDLLAKLRHPHLVCLLGHCIDDSIANKVFLVYEFIQNGSFLKHLSESGLEKRLEWLERLNILIGVAKAVHFLHTGVISSFLNNRLKTNNILLTEHRMAKLSDYGLSIVSEDNEKQGVNGDGRKSWQMTNSEDDIYSFGFIIFESLVGSSIATSREAFPQNDLVSLGTQEGQRRLLDPTVLATSFQESLTVVISIMNKCISSELSTRPSFEDILWNLQYAAQVQATANGDLRS